jgi:hypothetical protein
VRQGRSQEAARGEGQKLDEGVEGKESRSRWEEDTRPLMALQNSALSIPPDLSLSRLYVQRVSNEWVEKGITDKRMRVGGRG